MKVKSRWSCILPGNDVSDQELSSLVIFASQYKAILYSGMVLQDPLDFSQFNPYAPDLD
jgi:hypothetical protein